MSFRQQSIRRGISSAPSDDELDVEILLQLVKEDSEQLFSLRLNNIKVDPQILQEIFDLLKTTKNVRHLSLAGIGMKDDLGLEMVKAFAENKSLESLNVESNDLTNYTIEPLCALLETHHTLREFKCAHQKNGLGSRGEEAMARALDKNENLLKIGYPFNVPSARSLADRSQIRNNELQRKKRTAGACYYNYKEEIARRDACPQPWIKDSATAEEKNEQMIKDIGERKRSMKKVQGSEASRRFAAQQRAKENAKPSMDNELAMALGKARKASQSVA